MDEIRIERGEGGYQGRDMYLRYPTGTASDPEIRALLAASQAKKPMLITGIRGTMRGGLVIAQAVGGPDGFKFWITPSILNG